MNANGNIEHLGSNKITVTKAFNSSQLDKYADVPVNIITERLVVIGLTGICVID